MTKTARLVMAVVGVAVIIGVILFMRNQSSRAGGGGAGPSASGSAGGGDRAIPVATAVATRKDVPVILEGLGTVTPLATVTQNRRSTTVSRASSSRRAWQ